MSCIHFARSTVLIPNSSSAQENCRVSASRLAQTDFEMTSSVERLSLTANGWFSNLVPLRLGEYEVVCNRLT
jgi:hypothetical protein